MINSRDSTDANRIMAPRPLSWRRTAFLACMTLFAGIPAQASVTLAPGPAEAGGHWWYVTWINDGKDGGTSYLGGRLDWYAEGGWTPWGYSFTWGDCNANAAGCFQRVAELHGNPFRMWQHDSDANKPMCFGKNLVVGFKPFSNGQCVTTTAPPKPVCSLSQPAALAHGNLAVANVHGSVSNVSASISCTQVTNVKVRAILSVANPTSNVPVRADGSITSHLTINGSDGAVGVNVAIVAANSPTLVTLTSTLATQAPTAGALTGAALVIVDVPLQRVQRPISITGNVIAPSTAPKAALIMAAIQNAQSNLGITWSWSTSSADYGSTQVPANYSVGLFIRNVARDKWSAFRVDATASAVATWAQRIQRFHDKYASGGIREPASRVFESGTWCVTLAAASTPETGGSFVQAPGAAESCVSIPAKKVSR